VAAALSSGARACNRSCAPGGCRAPKPAAPVRRWTRRRLARVAQKRLPLFPTLR